MVLFCHKFKPNCLKTIRPHDRNQRYHISTFFQKEPQLINWAFEKHFMKQKYYLSKLILSSSWCFCNYLKKKFAFIQSVAEMCSIVLRMTSITIK